MGVVFRNNGFSLLSAGIDDSTTSIPVVNGSDFPEPGADEWFAITVVGSSLPFEIMHCTARSGNTLTVQRGREGTSARAFGAGARVDHRMTAGTLAESFAAAALHADRAEEAADVAEANNNGPIAPDWNGELIYFSKRRVRHNGVNYYANQTNIGQEPSSDSAYWTPDPYFQAVMKADVPASWPAGLEFSRPIHSENGGRFIVPADQILRNNTTPTISNGKEWLTGKWTPKGPSTYIRYKVWASLNIFAEASGKISLALFVGSTFRGATTVDFAAGEHKPVYFEGVDVGAPAAGEYDVSLRAGNTATGGTTFWLNRNTDNALYGNGLHSRLGVSERVIQP